MVIFRFILGGLLAVGSVNISNAMSDEAVKKNENFPLYEEVDDITNEIFCYVTSQLIEKGKPLSVDEAKAAIFEINKRTAKELKSRGFDVKEKGPVLQKEEDIPDEDAMLFLSEFYD